ncbi:MAG: hypothetical protein OEZ43_18420 [Gammaproteobacteria bacterium]|nr:hypothetical protein [Gammaproteobacteria bacterium]
MRILLSLLLSGLSSSVLASEVSVPHAFEKNAPAVADEVNENFNALAEGINDNNSRLGGVEARATENQAATVNNQQGITANKQNIQKNTDAIANNKADINAQNAKIDALGIDPLGASLSRQLTGLVAVFSNGVDVTGDDNTLFLQELNVGDSIKIADHIAKVVALSTNKLLTIDPPHPSGAVNANAYTDENLLTLRNSADATKLIVDKSGAMMRRIAYARGELSDGLDSGQIPGRLLTFKKQFDKDTSVVRIGYSDSFRVYGHGKACQWELRVNGVSCPGAPLHYALHVSNSAGDISNHHRQGSVFGYCEGLDAGVHEIQVWVGQAPGYSGSDCATGWNTTWTLEAEEVLK